MEMPRQATRDLKVKSDESAPSKIRPFAKRPLNIDGFLKALNRKKGALDKRVADVLGDQLVKQDQIQYRADQVGFAVKPGVPGNVVPLIVELQYK